MPALRACASPYALCLLSPRLCAGNMKTLHDCHRRYRILGGFGADPVRCTQLLIAEAAKNVRIVRTGVEGAEYSQVSASEHFKGAWAQDAVVQYLQKCQATGRI